MKRLPALLLTAAVLSGCGGPQRPVDLGFKEVPSNVVLGSQTSPTPTPTGPSLAPLPPPPSVVSLPPPPFELPPVEQPPPPPPPTASACPAPDLLAAPRLEATTTISEPPVQASYLFDNVGSYAVSGANARRGAFPLRTVRFIRNVVRTSDVSFDYDVSELIGDTTTTTTYRVLNDELAPPPGKGLYLVKMTYLRSDGKSAQFAPVQPILIAALPLLRGATSDQRGIDPQTQTVMTFTTTIEGKARVFACGEPLDTWTVHLTKGVLTSPNQDLDFDSTYQLATQYGGIVLADAVAFTGTDNGDGVQRSNRASIAAVPRAP